MQSVPIATADDNEFQPFTIPNPNPGSWEEIKKVVDPTASNDPQENIHANMEEAMCGGWDFNILVNGVFEQEEILHLNDKDMVTYPEQGLISKVTGVPGRDTTSAYGNLFSGLGVRRETDGTAKDIEYDEELKRRVETENFSGFDYPTTGVCGLATICRPPSHPDRRGSQDSIDFFCDHPCQRPLDDPGKPKGWKETDSTLVKCDTQQPYEPVEDQVMYSCGGKETKGPGENFCEELNENGQLGGLCQDINNYVYIRWEKLVHICLDENMVPTKIMRNEKGTCGFPAEVDSSEESRKRREDDWEEAGVFECCSDAEFPGGKTYNFTEKGMNCIPCNGEECRLNPKTKSVITNDAWLEPFPTPENCSTPFPDNEADRLTLTGNLAGMGIDIDNAGVNIGAWQDPEPGLELVEEDREYISFFREYENAGYERAEMLNHVPNDDHKKQDIPIACYGLYDMAPENARIEQTDAEDKRCVIAAYYEADDGDGDGINFWNMAETQQGKAFFDPEVADDPFDDPKRFFNEESSLWFPQLGNAFSMLNEKVFIERYNTDLSFALLTTDSARQRTTVQHDLETRLSSGTLMRTFDDSIDPNRTVKEDPFPSRVANNTIPIGPKKESRTIVEWWHGVETEMHKSFTPPTIRLLLPTTWSVDINPLDPIYTPPLKKLPSEDIQSESIEIQVQAGENLLGDIASFMERNLLLRVEGEPIPIVVPMANPTELRAWAQGWQAWAQKQEDEGLNGASEARAVAIKLLEYADQADNVRELRGELPRYAANLLYEQAKVSTKIAQWVTDNMTAYQNYLTLQAGNNLLQERWELTQAAYRSTSDNDAFPWCRNTRFTAPIYSMLDPWLPGRENEGDVSAGLLAIAKCLTEGGPCDVPGIEEDNFTSYFSCLSNIKEMQEKDPTTYPTNRVCDQYLPHLPPLLPTPPDTKRDADLILDFTAFREVQKSVKLPVLKPIQIRIDFNKVRPPGLEHDSEPEYPELADLPSVLNNISQDVIDSIPKVITPSGEDFDLFKDAPEMNVPELDVLSLGAFLNKTFKFVEDMTKEYDLFWNSLTQKPCENGETENCIRENTEQDCVKPHDDPNGRCVHFEADLKERLQRIGSRPAIFLAEDFLSIGKFREPLIYGQEICEKEDWACQLLNAYNRAQRGGWQLDISDEYDPSTFIQKVKEKVRNASSNIIKNNEDRFLFDINQNQIFENYRVPEGERIEQYIERFEPPQ